MSSTAQKSSRTGEKPFVPFNGPLWMPGSLIAWKISSWFSLLSSLISAPSETAFAYLICLIMSLKSLYFIIFLWPEAESNCRPLVFQTSALPTELSGLLRGRRDSNPRPPAWQAGVNSRLYHAPNSINMIIMLKKLNTIKNIHKTKMFLWRK